MLFEVFFDPKARLRKEFKPRRFEDLFALQQHKNLSSSFDFITECLLPEAGHFYSIPGRKHPMVLDIATTADSAANTYRLKSIHCGGAGIMWLEDEDYSVEPGEIPNAEKMNIAKFEARLAEQMVIPSDLLTVNYLSFNKQGNERILFPYGWTVRKR